MNLKSYLALYRITAADCGTRPAECSVLAAMLRLVECQAGHASDPDPQEFGALSLAKAIDTLRNIQYETRPHGGESVLSQQAGWVADYGDRVLAQRQRLPRPENSVDAWLRTPLIPELSKIEGGKAVAP